MPRHSKFVRSRLANLKKTKNHAHKAGAAEGDGTEVSGQPVESTGVAVPDCIAEAAAASSAAGDGPPTATSTGVSDPVGHRIFDMGALTSGINILMTHTKDCWQPSFVGEQRKGLEAFLRYNCHRCGTDFHIAKQENVSLNSQAVYAAVATGSGYSAMEAQMAILDIPFMSFKSFSDLQDDVGEVSFAWCKYSVCAWVIIIKNVIGLKPPSK